MSINVTLGNRNLVAAIAKRIAAHPLQAIPFKEYMELCLYHEPYGYYRSSKPKIGKAGDFYTSSSVGTIMGEMIARYIVQHRQEISPSEIALHVVEWGGGTGRLALHLLDELQKTPSLYESLTYTMIETSPYHRQLQKETLTPHRSKLHWMTEREWLDNGPDRGVLVLANELLDAFPVHWVEYEQGTYEEIYVAWNEAEKRFYEKKLPIAAGPLLDYLQEELPAPEEGQRLEVNLEALEWISRVTSKLQQGQVMVVDYGDESHELYAPHRMRGTLICYRNHQAAEQPYAYQGEQDITAHVNFTACRRAGLEAGAQQAVLCNQREFLLQQGILDRLQETFGLDPFGPEAKRNRAIRQLLLSDQMSELFKVLILKKA